MNMQILPITNSNIEEIVDLHMDAFRGYTNTKLGRKYVTEFVYWFASQGDSICLTAVSGDGGKVLGYVVGAPEGYQKKMNSALLPQAVWQSIFNPRVIFERNAWRNFALRLRMLLRRPVAPVPATVTVMRLVSMAVVPEARGIGVGANLASCFESIAYKKGFSKIELSVYNNNRSAITLYEKCGYILKGDKSSSEVLCYQKNAESKSPNCLIPHASDIEGERIKIIYSKRKAKTPAGKYSHFTPSHLCMLQELESEVLGILKKNDIDKKVDHVKILDIGCGNGFFLRQMVQWGFSPENLYGIDILDERIEYARRLSPASITFKRANADSLEFATASFDIVSLFTVFSSIMEHKVRRSISSEILRVLKPGGKVLWYDFFYNNPNNIDVRGVDRTEIERLFPDCTVNLTRVTPAPPLIRTFFPNSILGYLALASLPVLCTHYLGTIQKE